MTRSAVVTIMLVLAAGSGVTQGAETPAPDQMQGPMSPCMQRWQSDMQRGPMAGMMSAMDTASWAGFVYVLHGNVLEKRDAEGSVVAAVELEDFEQIMQEIEETGICPVCGMDMEEMAEAGCPMMGGQGRMQGGGMMHGQGQGMMQGGGMMHGQGQGMMQGGGMMHGQGQGMMQGGGMMHGQGQGMTPGRMHGMQRGQMMSCVRLDADAEGVYLLRGGKMTVFDHDLNQKSSWRIETMECPANERMRAMAMEQMGRERCPHCRMHSGMGMDRAQRSIPMGSVEMWYYPRMLMAGPARFHVQVFGANLQPDANAQVSAYLYPANTPGSGMGVAMQPLGAGQYYGLAQVPSAGQWELAVRVMRPDMDDARAYYGVSVQ